MTIRSLVADDSGDEAETGAASPGDQSDSIGRANWWIGVIAMILFLGGLAIWVCAVALLDPWFPAGMAPVLWVASAVAGLLAVVWGSQSPGAWKMSLFKVLVATVATSPVLAVAVVLSLQSKLDVAAYIGIVGTTSVALGAIYAALLKSDVSGWRKDVLQLSLIEVGLIGALTTAIGALMTASG